MANDLFARYVWLMDTIRRYGRITREELNKRWLESSFSNGRPIPRRSFYNYRTALEELFNVNIECDPHTFEYYIEEPGRQAASVTDWMLNSTAVSNALSDAREISDRIFLEDVPSAREHLHVVIDALKVNRALRFDYHPYTRSKPNEGVVIEPYFLKIFRQRWYITGRNVKEDRVKTYALDRMSGVTMLENTFTLPDNFDAGEYCRNSFGIVFNLGRVHHVVLRVEPQKAKYFRALPLHHSQREMVHDRFSTFTYDLRLTPDFVSELLSHGSAVTVIDPPELRAMMVKELQTALDCYQNRE